LGGQWLSDGTLHLVAQQAGEGGQVRARAPGRRPRRRINTLHLAIKKSVFKQKFKQKFSTGRQP